MNEVPADPPCAESSVRVHALAYDLTGRPRKKSEAFPSTAHSRRWLLRAKRFFAELLKDRHCCSSRIDWLKVAALWILARTSPVRIPAMRTRILFRQLAQPVTLRMGTSDILVAREIFCNSEYAGVLACDMGERPTIIDLGSNIGLAVLYFHSLMKAALVLAVEPDETNMRLLEGNCTHIAALNQLKTKLAFVSRENGKAGIDRTRGEWGFRKIDHPANSGEEITCVSMSALIEEFDLGIIDLLKCDVEGAEREIFASCSPWIGQVRNLLVEVHPPYSLKELYADLKSAGWSHEILEEQKTAGNSLCLLKQMDRQLAEG